MLAILIFEDRALLFRMQGSCFLFSLLQKFN
jgi:hypothetical protein